MKQVSFNVEEENAVAIYHGKTRIGTIESMLNVARYIRDDDMRKVISSAASKLGLISDDEYEKRIFTYTE